jgi:hypothetical protein
MRESAIFGKPLSISWRTIGALMIVAANAACYRYAPVTLGTAASTTEVRVRVTEAAAARLSQDLGAFTTEIDGQLTPQGADSISVAVPIERAYRGITVGTTTQTLFLGRSEVVEVRKREFDRVRTTLVTAGIVVGFGVLAAAVVQLADPNPDSQDSPQMPPPASPTKIPRGHGLIVRIPIP